MDDKIVNLFSVVKDRQEDQDKAVKESVAEAFDKAIEQDLRDVMIMGWKDNGEMVLSFACDSAPEMIFMLELVKREILDGARKTD
jgi:hypothetical protein